MKITRHCLRVKNPEELVDFYEATLGMRNFGEGKSPLLGYDAKQCLLELSGGARQDYIAEPDALYWKIGITVRDLDAAVISLQQWGHDVTDPRQFRDIGYMSHLRDPQGFSIELLQQGFEGRAQPAGNGHPVGGQATLSHITLRVNNIEAARLHCENRLGMRLMSVQPVDDYGFSLYFFCWSNERLPKSDLEAVENREWLWARPYALLELQHIFAGTVHPTQSDDKQADFAGFAYQAEKGGAHNYVPAYVMNEWL
ncbi:MAG: VOC family protein [Pseudomonadota bacterium]